MSEALHNLKRLTKTTSSCAGVTRKRAGMLGEADKIGGAEARGGITATFVKNQIVSTRRGKFPTRETSLGASFASRLDRVCTRCSLKPESGPSRRSFGIHETTNRENVDVISGTSDFAGNV